MAPSGLPIGWAGLSNTLPDQVQQGLPTGDLTCPIVVHEKGSLTLQSMTFHADCHIASALVRMTSTWVMDSGPRKANCLFGLPLTPEATVTDVVVKTGDRMFASFVIEKSEAEELKSSAKPARGGQSGPSIKPKPGLFTTPIPMVKAKEELTVEASWFQPLQFYEGYYFLALPTYLTCKIAQQKMTMTGILPDLIKVFVTINTGVPYAVSYTSVAHNMDCKKQVAGHVQLETSRAGMWNNTMFQVGYQVWGNAIVAALNVQMPKADSVDPRGTFSLSISPPTPANAQPFARSVVFLLDCSGSMTGEPMAQAQAAVNFGLKQLNPYDEFAVIAYHSEQFVFQEGNRALLQANPNTCMNAQAWVSSITAGGLTNILSPLQNATAILQQARGLKYIFLVTDGAVHDEREIVQWAASIPADVAPRICTFGIGPYCNHFFLKQLAVTARGLNDKAMTASAIKTGIEKMLTAAAKPILSYVEVGIQGLPPGAVEMFPFPAPDLFCGAPVLISGKFSTIGGAHFPAFVILRGRLPSGQIFEQQVQTTAAANIPLDKIFVKQQLDQLIARSWLDQDENLRQSAIALSVREGVQCALTTNIVFQTTPEKHDQLKQARVKGELSKGKNTASKALAAVAVGGVGTLAILPFALDGGFGDVSASMANTGVGDFFSNIGGGLGDIDFSFGDLSLPDLDVDVGDLCGDCGDFCGDCCGSCQDACSCITDLLDS